MHLKAYRAWDLPVRLFHWVNFLSVVTLVFLGLVMLYKKELGITGDEARIALKEVHVIVGYLFALNLLWRIVWGFVGGPRVRWRQLLPGKGYAAELRRYLVSARAGHPPQYLGHNPLGRLAVSFIFLLLTVLALSGLVRAATDIYYPPLGSFAAAYVARPGVDPAQLRPYAAEGVDEQRMAALKAFKGPFGTTHKYAAYLLMAMILLHVFFVVRSEVREGGALVSAMINGRKVLKEAPVDEEVHRG